ncbi:MAG TPA: ankyrin repeat domain-containing protein [Verrucomicrobiae bacterium]|nr:ankyrin repeat domain-containing protein [Verrucomicrobiae bacterium]
MFAGCQNAKFNSHPAEVGDVAPADRQRLGEDLLKAALEQNWNEVERLTELGGDPNVVVLPPRLTSPFDRWPRRPRASALNMAARFGRTELVQLLLKAGADIEGKTVEGSGDTPLMEAVRHRHYETVRILLDHGASVSRTSLSGHSVTALAWTCGDEDIIRMFQKLNGVPVWERHLPEARYAARARTAKPQLIPGTSGAVPLINLLWTSDTELLVLRENPRSFTLVNIQNGAVTELPELTKCWESQPTFDDEMLTLSPDRKWLLGFGGMPDKQLWIATTLDGRVQRQWPRDTHAEARIIAERQPPVIWLDAARWIELRNRPTNFARIRSVENDTVITVPLSVPDYLGDHSGTCLMLSDGSSSHPCGSVGVRSSGSNETYVARLCRLIPDPTQWRIEVEKVTVRNSTDPGTFMTSPFALSPRRDRIAWLNYFSTSGTRALLISDVDGNDLHVVYQKIDYHTAMPDTPRVVSWSPTGEGLLFWGYKADKGLWLIKL